MPLIDVRLSWDRVLVCGRGIAEEVQTGCFDEAVRCFERAIGATCNVSPRDWRGRRFRTLRPCNRSPPGARFRSARLRDLLPGTEGG